MMMLSHEYVSDDVCVGGNQASAHLPWGHASAEQRETAMDASAIGYMAHCSTGSTQFSMLQLKVCAY